MVNQGQLSRSVAAIMSHYGVHIAPEDTRVHLESSEASAPVLISAALRDFRKHGFVGAQKDVALDDLPRLAFPALLIMKDGEVLLIHGRGQGHFTVSSALAPEIMLEVEHADIASRYSGLCLFVKPENSARNRSPDEYPKRGTSWLIRPIMRNLIVYRDVFATALIANLLAAGIALFAMQVYDRVIPNKAFDTLWILASGVLIAALMEFSLRLIRSRMIEISGRDIDIQLSGALYQQVMGIRMERQPKSVGSFISQIRELSSVREFLTTNTISSVSDLPFSILFMVIIGLIGGPVVLVVMAAAAMSILPGLLFGKKLSEHSRNGTKEGAIYSGLLFDTLNNVETVKALGAEARLMKSHEDLASTVAVTASRGRLLTSIIMQISTIAQQASYVGVIIVGAYQISEGVMTTGALVACTILSSRTLSPMNQVGQLLTRWQMVRSSAENLNRIMQSPVDRGESEAFLRPERIQGAYRIQQAAFTHEGASGPSLLIEDLEIKAGERVALLGGIGSGKTTLLRLLSGLYEVGDGKFLLDGLSLSRIDPSIRTSRIGYLPQNVGVFQGSLRDNLRAGSQKYTDEEMMSALSAVGLGGFVEANPRGLEMYIPSAGSLSGGQRQAVGLARLLLQDPDVVLLDEPTASLDQGTEAKIVKHMQTWLEGRTLIMATHKREVLPMTDRVIVLAGGKIYKDAPLTREGSKMTAVPSGRVDKVEAGA